jgi:hypothetical protein
VTKMPLSWAPVPVLLLTPALSKALPPKAPSPEGRSGSKRGKQLIPGPITPDLALVAGTSTTRLVFMLAVVPIPEPV